MFHGTTSDPQSIFEHGFLMSHVKRTACGFGIYFAVAAHNMYACFCPCSCGLHWSPTDPDKVKSSEEHGSHFLPVQEQQSRLRHSSCSNRRPALTSGLSLYKAGLLTSGWHLNRWIYSHRVEFSLYTGRRLAQVLQPLRAGS